ncbi:hypothetical protein K450DRAFT_302285 [Umbelopsis ramanniana AG]|uniref:Uncharacterized protein n=1 Tax=Umbelopsis ramanniana AG TaxID=1314678 RepID=A0AAD5HBP6_UMBRA|nr:uncharacterized protein K450DRAFT_302285 [Umbelopsis ramanniana AG]KAI8577049.1 hypothetical protein K450DRAFT_302285 [Umbelopsis ramanniana AG]
MHLYKILLLTDQQLNRGSSSIDNTETIDREYATLAEEVKTKYNAVVEEMFKHKYSNATQNHGKDAEAVTLDIVKIVDKNSNPQPSSVSGSPSPSHLIIVLLILLFAFWSVRISLQQDLSGIKSSLEELIILSLLFLFLSTIWLVAIGIVWLIVTAALCS